MVSQNIWFESSVIMTSSNVKLSREFYNQLPVDRVFAFYLEFMFGDNVCNEKSLAKIHKNKANQFSQHKNVGNLKIISTIIHLID